MMGVSLAENVYDDPYDLALSDPVFSAAATAAHTGRWSLQDALWWEWHPEEAAPSGTPSPISRLRVLQRRVFAEDGDAAGDHTVAQVVRELEAEIVAERAAITEAIVAARADLERRTADRAQHTLSFGDLDLDLSVNPAADPADLGSDRANDPDPDRANDADPAAPSARRRLLPALILIAALVAAAVIGGFLGNRLTIVGQGPAASPTPTASAKAPANPAALFAQAQRPEDIPAAAVSAAFEPESFRYLGSAGWPDEANAIGLSPFYAARAADGLICLVAVPEGSGYLSTCAGESAYPAAGLRLYWESTDFLAQMGPNFFVEEGMEGMIGDVSVAWSQTGEASSGWTLRSLTEP